MILELLLFTIINADPQASVLEFSGPKGIEFFGHCITKQSGEKKEITGVTPAKVTLDINVEKCSIQKKGSSGTLTIRLFHNQKLITDKNLSQPMSGVELVIPFF